MGFRLSLQSPRSASICEISVAMPAAPSATGTSMISRRRRWPAATAAARPRQMVPPLRASIAASRVVRSSNSVPRKSASAASLRLDGADIGGADPGELFVAIAQPDRVARRIEQRAKRVKLAVGAQQPFAQTRGFEAVAGDIADAHDGAPAHRATIEFERPAGEAFDVEVKGLAARPAIFPLRFRVAAPNPAAARNRSRECAAQSAGR